MGVFWDATKEYAVDPIVKVTTEITDELGLTNIEAQKQAAEREQQQMELAKQQLEMEKDKAAKELERQKKEVSDAQNEARDKRKKAGKAARRGEGAGGTILTRRAKKEEDKYIYRRTLLGGSENRLGG